MHRVRESIHLHAPLTTWRAAQVRLLKTVTPSSIPAPATSYAPSWRSNRNSDWCVSDYNCRDGRRNCNLDAYARSYNYYGGRPSDWNRWRTAANGYWNCDTLIRSSRSPRLMLWSPSSKVLLVFENIVEAPTTSVDKREHETQARCASTKCKWQRKHFRRWLSSISQFCFIFLHRFERFKDSTCIQIRSFSRSLHGSEQFSIQNPRNFDAWNKVLPERGQKRSGHENHGMLQSVT